jgi:hypothetical protein
MWRRKVLLPGDRFRLKLDTLAIDSSGEKRITLTVPAGAIIKVIRSPQSNTGLCEVRWSGKKLWMFDQDILRRGREI